ncbi:MAG: hypothetical protein CENE_01797 [Candidatus Celerinatantimonas neptuna]|nr:MAG: hypothetical protein CENE_01797 [Candidatus Celerinatantimonas neptuna]
MDKLFETFCDVDDFCQVFNEKWQQSNLPKTGSLRVVDFVGFLLPRS